MPRDTDLHKAAYKGEVKAIKALLQNNPGSVNEEGAGGRTALHRAVSGNQKGAVTVLLSMKADPNAVDASGRTPLHWAAICNAIDCAILLVDAGSDINCVTKVGATPLHFAAEGGKAEMVTWLAAQPAIDLQATDKDGMTAYDLAKLGFKTSREDGKAHKSSMKVLKPAGGGGCLCF